MSGKKYKKMIEDFEDKEYSVKEAIKKAKSTSYSKFPGSLDLHVAIYIPKEKEAKSIKGSFSMPHTIKTEEVRVAVFCEASDVEKAKKAGAVEAGLEDLIKKIQGGWTDFDVILAVPSVMAKIAVLGKELGPKGLMPNPKTGTLVEDVEAGIKDFQKGKTKYACDEGGAIHVTVGKVDTEDEKVEENIMATIKSISEGIGKSTDTLLKSVHLSPTMGAGVRITLSSFF